MVEGGAGSAILVDKSEGGAGDVFGTSGSEAFGNSLDQGGFAGAEVAAEEHDERRLKFGGQGAAEGNCFLGRMSDGFGGHHERQYSEKAGGRSQVSGKHGT